MAKKDDELDPLEQKLCLLEFTADDLVNETVGFKEELKVVQSKQIETQKTVEYLSESISLIKEDELTDINSFKKLSLDLSDFKFILENYTSNVNSMLERIKRHQETLTDVMKELEVTRQKMAKRQSKGKLLEFKIP